MGVIEYNSMVDVDIKKLLEEQQIKTEKRIGEFKDEIKGYIGVLVEDFDKKIELIAEQHKSIMEVLREHTRQIEDMKTQIMEMNIRLGHIEEQLRRKIDYEDFEKLEKRVALLEAK